MSELTLKEMRYLKKLKWVVDDLVELQIKYNVDRVDDLPVHLVQQAKIARTDLDNRWKRITTADLKQSNKNNQDRQHYLESLALGVVDDEILLTRIVCTGEIPNRHPHRPTKRAEQLQGDTSHFRTTLKSSDTLKPSDTVKH